jgi:hypothetical protein
MPKRDQKYTRISVATPARVNALQLATAFPVQMTTCRICCGFNVPRPVSLL